MGNSGSETKNYGLDVTAVEQKLRALWEKMAEADSERSEAVLRACVMNLIVYNDLDWPASRMYDTISEISREHPSRIFLILPGKDGEAGVEAEVTAQCHSMGAPRQHVCCEIIRILASRDQLDRLPGGIRSLLVADLPVVLWWRAELEHSVELLGELAGEADRIIVNSKGCRARREDVRKLIGLLGDNGPGRAVGDLNWSRLTHWRNAVAGLFDSPPWNDCLKKIRKVRVRCADRRSTLPLQPLLLTGWLASRLGWEPVPGLIEKEAGRFQLRATASVEEATCEFGIEQDEEYEGLLSVELESAGSSPQLFRAERSPDGKYVHSLIVQDDAERTPRLQLLFREGEAELLRHELEILTHDASYEEALEFVACWLEPGEGQE